VTPSVSSKGASNASDTHKGLTASPPDACTNACTNNPETGNAATVEALAAALQALSPADRQRLAALLSGQPEGTSPRPDFARDFAAAFDRLDAATGGHNHVSLVDLRRALPVERAAFDAGLAALRRAGRYTVAAAEGRHAIKPEERTAGIVEDGTLLLFVARRVVES
jgi:hypothetical protein